MYRMSYAETEIDSVADARDRERQLMDRSIELLEEARAAGANSFAATEAIHFLNRVWSSFIDDLGNPDNALPRELRASLISIGLWLLRESEAVRQGETDSFDGLIEVSQIIRDGIQ